MHSSGLRRWSITLVGLFCLFCWTAQLTGQSAPPSVAGDYAGTLGSLHLVLHVERDSAGRMTGSIDSPDQGAHGIPCEDFALSGTQFSFTVAAVHGTYSGTVSPDGKTLTGTWNQGAPMPLVLTQSTGAPAFVAAEKPSPVDGDWTGAIDTPGGPLRAVIHLKSDRTGKEYLTFDSPSQGAYGLEGANAALKDDALSFDLPVVHGHYDGKLSADQQTITGTWNQGLPLALNFSRIAPFIPADKPSAADGDWSGVLQTSDGPLHAAIHVKSNKTGKEYVTFDSPDQDTTNLETADAVLSGKEFSFKVPELKGAFSGTVSADGASITGTWNQDGSLPLTLTKSAGATSAAAGPIANLAKPLPLAEIKDKFDNELRPMVENSKLAGSRGIGVAIGIYAHGRRQIYTYGVAREDSLFEIGSITKTFTGLILSKMVTDGKVTLDTPVRELLPPGTVSKPQGPEITLLSLATHHSGMARMPDNFHPADPANPYADYAEKDLFAYIGKSGLALKPDAKFEYSNVGMGLLGDALAHKAGEAYGVLLKRDVLDPLHMDHTFIQIPAANQDQFLSGHDGSNKPVHAWDLDSMAPAGGIRSDVRDMLKYVEAQLHPPTGLTQAVSLQHQLQADMEGGKIAINWMFEPRGENYNHGGMTGGFASYAFFKTKDDIAGIVLVNRASALAESLGMQIAATLEGLPAYPLRR